MEHVGGMHGSYYVLLVSMGGVGSVLVWGILVVSLSQLDKHYTTRWKDKNELEKWDIALVSSLLVFQKWSCPGLL